MHISIAQHMPVFALPTSYLLLPLPRHPFHFCNCRSEGALHELPPIASSAEYDMPAAELASRRDLRGPDHFTCRSAH